MVTEVSASPLANPTNRPTPAADDPRARAAARAQALQDHWNGISPDENDKYYVDPKVIPDGWTYMWRTLTVLGQPADTWQISLASHGWEDVPAKRHPDMMPTNWTGNTIIREGMKLMEIPTVIAEARYAEEQRRARQQVGDKEAQLAGNPQGTFERTAPKIGRSYEAMAIPK